MPKDPNIDEDAVQRAIQPGIEHVQQELNSKLQDTVRAVRDEMEGQPSEHVYNELVTRVRAAVPGFRVDDDAMKRVAEEIEAGTLEG